MQALEENKKQVKKELRESEAELEKVKTEMVKTVEKGKNNASRVVQLEIENEELQTENRHLGFVVNDLEQKFDTQLEELELLQSELEEQREYSQEQIERLKQEVQELTVDLQAKEREIRSFKVKSIL